MPETSYGHHLQRDRRQLEMKSFLIGSRLFFQIDLVKQYKAGIGIEVVRERIANHPLYGYCRWDSFPESRIRSPSGHLRAPAISRDRCGLRKTQK
ncbi:hypothetical protein GEV33_003251 [Tenebrio molitor]|uniref:Uncharacterized protein n=1 Tax=Tenebrio molitor TaxID=7067 RepID=A0A8J6HRP6_TENMO|nr:hypothetical protein GEV33_003251 [Tenebrio molitor]